MSLCPPPHPAHQYHTSTKSWSLALLPLLGDTCSPPLFLQGQVNPLGPPHTPHTMIPLHKVLVPCSLPSFVGHLISHPVLTRSGKPTGTPPHPPHHYPTSPKCLSFALFPLLGTLICTPCSYGVRQTIWVPLTAPGPCCRAQTAGELWFLGSARGSAAPRSRWFGQGAAGRLGKHIQVLPHLVPSLPVYICSLHPSPLCCLVLSSVGYHLSADLFFPFSKHAPS